MQKVIAASVSLSKEALKPAPLFDGSSAQLLRCLDDLLEQLRAGPDDPRVASVVFMPLYSLLQQQQLGREQTLRVLQLLALLCESAFVTSPEFTFKLALQLLSVSMFLLNPTQDEPDGVSEAFKHSEAAFKLAGFHCAHVVLALAARRGYPIATSPTVPPLLVLALASLQQDRELELELELLGLLKTILQQLSPVQVRLVLPKVSSRLANMVNVVNKRHFRVKILALSCLKLTLCAAHGDAQTERPAGPGVEASPLGHSGGRDFSDSEDTVNVPERIALIYAIVYRLFRHHVKGRPELLVAILDFACVLIKSGLKGSDLVRIVVSAASIDAPVLQERYALAMEDSTIQAEICALAAHEIQELPASMQSLDVAQLRTRCDLLSAAVRLGKLGAWDLLRAVQSALSFRVRRNASVQARENATEMIMSIDPYDPTSSAEPVPLFTMGIEGLEPDAEAVVGKLVRTLASASPEVVGAMCLQLYETKRQGELHAVEQLWVMSNLVSGLPETPNLWVEELIGHFYDRLVYATDFSEHELIVNNASNVHTAFTLYTLGECVLRLTQERAKNLLVDLVHPLFCLVGDRNSLDVKLQAGICIAKLAHSSGYNGPVQMAIDNKDYLVDGFSIQLNTLNIAPSTLDSLASLIYVCGPPIVPLLSDTFQSLFVLLNYYHQYYQVVRSTITVFGALAKVMNDQIKLPRLITSAESRGGIVTGYTELVAELGRVPRTQFEDDATATLDDIQASLDAEANDTEVARADDDIEHLEDATLKNWNYPIDQPAYKILETVILYCDKLMTHEAPEIRFATLTLVNTLAPFLAINHDRFLPLVHKVWPEITARVFDAEIYVVEQSFKCLENVSACAESFVSKRIDDLWPKVLSRYGSLFSRRWPQFSQERRTQVAMCSCFTSILRLNLSLKALELTLVAMRPALLRDEFPQLLQLLQHEASVEVQDLIFLVLLDVPILKPGFREVTPVYKQPGGVIFSGTSPR